MTSLLFLAAAVYAVGYLAQRGAASTPTTDEDLPFTNFPEAIFTGCLLVFLATMSLVAVSRHLGLMWVAVEATTLASAPLIYFHRNPRSLEATWKYLVICSVGIALALLGNFFLAVAARSAGGTPIPLTLDDLAAHAGSLESALAQGGLPVVAGRLRHENGPGARCTPGCPTPIARPRRWSRPCCPGRC